MPTLEQFEQWLVSVGENKLRLIDAVNSSCSISAESADLIKMEREVRYIDTALVLLAKFRAQV